MEKIRPNSLVIIATAGFGLLSVWLWWSRCQKNKPPKKWRKVGTLSELICFPVKSMGPVKTTSLQTSCLGVRSGWMRDRIFMVIDLDKVFITARQHPKMVLIMPSFVGSVLTLDATKVDPSLEKLSVDVAKLDKRRCLKVTIYNQHVDVLDCGDEASKWLSRCLMSAERGLRLVYYSSDEPTRIMARQFKNMENCDMGAFPDETSFSLINQASIDDLNSKLKVSPPITNDQFRHNFVIKGPAAFEEDNWDWVKIGEVVFRHIRPCTRCVLTTIDPSTGIKSPNFEPVKTLRTYRRIEDPILRAKVRDTPALGIHLGLRGPDGLINLNDAIYVGDDS